MYLYVELWKLRPAWFELSQDEKKSWMDELLGGLQEQFQAGVEPIGLAFNDDDTPHSSEYDFFAVWKMPDKDVARTFENFVEDSGLHKYFEQVNTRGEATDIEEVVAAHFK